MHDALVIWIKSGILIGPLMLLVALLSLNWVAVVFAVIFIASGVFALRWYEYLYPEKTGPFRKGKS